MAIIKPNSLGWQKPLRGVRLNLSHPLAKYVMCAYVINEKTGDNLFDASGRGYDLALGAGETPGVWQDSMLYGDGNSGYYRIGLPYDLQLGNGLRNTISLLCIHKPTTVGSGEYEAFALGSSLSTFGRQIQIGRRAASARYELKIGGGGTAELSWTGGLVANKRHVVFGVSDGMANHSLYVDGILRVTNTTSVEGSNLNQVNSISVLSSYNGNGVLDRWVGGVELAVLFNKALTEEEVKKVSAFPYEMFYPSQRVIQAEVGPITYEIQADLDAILTVPIFTYERTANLDALLYQVYERQTDLDSILQATTEIQATLDAFVAGRGFQAASLDSVLQLISDLQANLDSILALSSEIETTLDAFLLEGGTRVTALDSILQTINNERSVTLDALVQIHDEIETTLDAIIYARRTRSTTLDSILTDFLTVNTTLDANLLQLGRTHRVWLTAYLFQSSSISTDLDAIITSALNERFTTLDANLLDIDRTLLSTLDAILGEGLKFPHECFVSASKESFKAAARERFVALPDTCKDRRRAI